MHTGFQQIRSTRHELRHLARCLQTCPDDTVPDVYHSLVKATEQLFRVEQQLMDDYAFPVRQTHLEQHARVLRGLHCVQVAVMQGATDQGRHIGGQLLLEWLRLHQNTVDTVFTVWAEYCDCGLIDPRSPDLSNLPTAH